MADTSLTGLNSKKWLNVFLPIMYSGEWVEQVKSSFSGLTVNSYIFKSVFNVVRLGLKPILSVMSTLFFPMKNRNTWLSDCHGHFSRKAWTKRNILLNLGVLLFLTSNFFVEICCWGVISLEFQILNQSSGHMV